MKKYKYIQQAFSILLLIVYVFSITPHSLFHTHDFPHSLVKTSLQSPQLSTITEHEDNDCDICETQQNSSYYNYLAAIEFSSLEHISVYSFYPLSFHYTFWEGVIFLRGPPSFSL
jgi:hypothetical protein